jgi:hypothetical protein
MNVPVASHEQQLRNILIAPLVALLLQSCIYLPRETTVYDQDCKIMARQLTLQITQVGVYGGCVNEGCAALLVAAGAVTAASAVVSGSIVVAGNIVYWFEKQGRCDRS